MLTTQYSLNPVRPAYRDDLAITRPVALPVGGPVGVGGGFPKGTVLALTGGAAASEVRTLTITGTPTGFNGTFTYTADKVYLAALANLVSAIPTAAQVQTALESIFGVGNVTVTKSSLVYTITFGGLLANRLIGGKLAFTAAFTAGSTPAAALATTTAGSCGAGQANVYLDGSVEPARAVLKYHLTLDPQGSRVTDVGSTGQPAEGSAYVSGYFFAADLAGLDTAAVSDPGFRLVEGNAITDAGAVIGVGV